MLLYESNYLKFQALIGALRPEDAHWISRVNGDNDLYLERTLVEPYTTTLRLTYYLRDSEGSEFRDPDITVRIYHDASQVEAVACRERHQHRLLRALARSHAGELSQRWQRNMMLNKWLDFLLDRGHGFC
jgi:uncharacterized protein YqiB (DUF1249 family)